MGVKRTIRNAWQPLRADGDVVNQATHRAVQQQQQRAAAQRQAQHQRIVQAAQAATEASFHTPGADPAAEPVMPPRTHRWTPQGPGGRMRGVKPPRSA